MFREIAGHRPGVITKIGLKTFVDPRLEGAKMNERTKEDLVELIEMDGEEWLRYKSFPVNVALIRATYCDEDGNATMDKEAATLDSLSIAQAAKNSGGIVLLQVEKVVQNGTLDPRKVKIPGIYVDGIVVSRPENHWQTYEAQYNPALCGDGAGSAGDHQSGHRHAGGHCQCGQRRRAAGPEADRRGRRDRRRADGRHGFRYLHESRCDHRPAVSV